MDEQAADGMTNNALGSGGPLPSFSRAMDVLTSYRGVDGSPSPNIAPSYLRGSTYMRLLEAQRRAESYAQREPARAADGGSAVDGSVLARPSLPSGVYRGISHSVIERAPPAEQGDAVPPLPSRWNKDDASNGAEVQLNPMAVRYASSKNLHDRDYEAGAARANHFMPPECGIYYYEVQILLGKRDEYVASIRSHAPRRPVADEAFSTTISVGFSTRNAALSRSVGWENESWGYHGDDGKAYGGHNTGRPYGPTFSMGDIIGCGVNFRERVAFFTKNGVKLGRRRGLVRDGRGGADGATQASPLPKCHRASFTRRSA